MQVEIGHSHTVERGDRPRVAIERAAEIDNRLGRLMQRFVNLGQLFLIVGDVGVLGRRALHLLLVLRQVAFAQMHQHEVANRIGARQRALELRRSHRRLDSAWHRRRQADCAFPYRADRAPRAAGRRLARGRNVPGGSRGRRGNALLRSPLGCDATNSAK